MSLEIKLVRKKKDLKKFMKFEWEINKNNDSWAPPLIMDMKKKLNKKKNPFFDHAEADFFLAIRDGKTVGRIAAIVDHYHNEYYSEKTGFWGFFECINDQEVANALFDVAMDWNKRRGMNNFRGPMSYGTNDVIGMQISGFEHHNVFLTAYNPEYYVGLCENYKMKKAKDLLSYYLDMENPIPDKVGRVANRVRDNLEKKDLKIRYLDRKNIERDIRIAFDIYEEAWKDNWGFVPMTEREFKENVADSISLITHKNLVVYIEDKGEAVGVAVTVYDINMINHSLKKFCKWPVWFQSMLQLLNIAFKIVLRKTPTVNWARLIIAGLKPGYRKRGLDALLYVVPFENGKELGIRHGEMSWELEDNLLINKALLKLGGVLYKTHRVWDKKIK